MNKLITSLATFAALSGSALAADLPSRTVAPAAPAAAIPPAFSWSGAYVGGYLGGAFGNSSIHTLNTNVPDVSVRISNPTVGIFAGVNYQFNNLVAGGEAEFGYDGSKGHSFYNNLTGTPSLRRSDSSENYVGRLRGRIGFTATPQLLLYAAGGLTLADQKIKQLNPANPAGELAINKNRTGWNIGVGAEYAFASNMTARFEYIYDGFSKKTYGFDAASASNWQDRVVGLNKSTVRAGVAMKF